VFAESKISKFEVPVGADENVIRFDVAMNVVHFVHIFQSKDQFCHIEASFCLCENVFFDEEAQEIASWDPLHCNVEIVGILERRSKLHQPLRPVPRQAFPLQEHTGYLLLVDQSFLCHSLYRHYLSFIR
jgi:hypothetical protein